MALLVGIAASSAAGPAAAGGGFTTVIELFTSQGCSSCPPADALLGKLARRDDMVALSLPVDYWDYLGWKDTLASPANSARQRAYAHARHDRAVYTPQVVVNGVVHAAGNDPASVAEASADARDRLEDEWVPISVDSKGDMLRVHAADSNGEARYGSGTLWLVLYSEVEEVSIKRGENAGRTIRYYNVVREMSPIGMWHGKAMSVDLPKSDVRGRGYDGCAVLLQAGYAGPIIGAAVLPGW
ncbi:MAG: DUF1223 domain-containing protein [Hyphomicrobiales bacterium]|nr:DUF1223 domain-containing protein [Hyphomicrobiales bacterium]